MRQWKLSPGLLLLVACLAGGCSGNAGGSDDGGAQLPPDNCNSEAEAASAPECQLSLGQDATGYIHPPPSPGKPDVDYYGVQLPSTLSPRSLIHVTAGFSAPSTQVNLSVDVRKENGSSLAKKVDLHGQGAPKLIDLIVPVTEPNTRLTLVVKDETPGVATPPYDARNGYVIKVEVLENPDSNEPNDTVPTQVVLAAQGAVQAGQETGFLATNDDVDLFEVTVPTAGQILWMHLTAPKQTPQAQLRMRYTLLRETGTTPTPISEGWVANEFLPVDLGTARLTSSGKYLIRVEGYRAPGSTASIPGDLRMQYTLDVSLAPSVDSNEPNANPSEADGRALSFGGTPGTSNTRSFTGRLEFVPDTDWFAVDVPALASPSLLSYKLTSGAGGGRFPPTPGSKDRQVLMFTQVTAGATRADRTAACTTDANVCPKGYSGNTAMKALVEGFCGGFDPPRCLQSLRQEADAFLNLRNFQGLIQVPAHGSAIRYYFAVQDEKNDFADDKDYTLEMTWLPDPGETVGLPSKALASTTNFPAPPTGAAFEMTGTLSFGHGQVLNHDLSKGEGVRGPLDYDGNPTDKDRFELTLPVLTAPEDRSWLVQWEIPKVNGAKVTDLAVELEFCDGETLTGGVCTPVAKSARGQPLVLAFDGRNAGSWHNPTGGLGEYLPLWTRSPDETLVTATAAGCFCLERRFMKGGKLYMTVTNVDRNNYDIASYTLRTAYTDYPKSYTTPTKTIACPAPVMVAGPPISYTGGCRFTNQ